MTIDNKSINNNKIEFKQQQQQQQSLAKHSRYSIYRHLSLTIHHLCPNHIVVVRVRRNNNHRSSAAAATAPTTTALQQPTRHGLDNHQHIIDSNNNNSVQQRIGIQAFQHSPFNIVRPIINANIIDSQPFKLPAPRRRRHPLPQPTFIGRQQHLYLQTSAARCITPAPPPTSIRLPAAQHCTNARNRPAFTPYAQPSARRHR